MIRPVTKASLSAMILTSVLAAQGHADRDIVDTAVAAGSFETLAAALEAADLVGALKGEGPFTVFAPTDEAFEKLPDHVLASLLEPENKDQLTAILTYHVAPGRLTAEEVAGRSSAPTLNGQRVSISVGDGGVRLNESRVVKTDIACSNGVIHVIDKVLLPATRDIAETASRVGRFNTLWAAAKAAGLAETIRGTGPFTVLAPTDEAFARLPAGSVQSLLKAENRAKLARILKYHVVEGRVFADQALAAGQAASLAGPTLAFGIRNGRLNVNEVNVIRNDVQASNGVIHVVDGVLLPPEPEAPRGRKFFGFTHETPGAALAAQLDLDRHSTLVLSSISTGSAAERAGLQRYDVLQRIGGQPATGENITRAKKDGDYGDTVEFVVLRGGSRLSLHVEIGEEKE